MALRPVDKLLAGYVGFLTVVIAARGGVGPPTWWLLGAHALFAVLLALFARLRPGDRIGQVLHDLYPLILLGGLYTELGLVSLDFGVGRLLEHDQVVQGWEEALFGLQISYEWIRRSPSVFWSGLLHFAYFTYYPIIYLTPIALLVAGRRRGAQDVVLATMIAFVACYVVFVFYPVGGPNYAFAHPTGPVREVWSARLVYGVLSLGSAIGTAFPSSHVAATVAVVATTWSASRRLFAVTLVPAVLLVVATVYCQMHYGVDALAGLAVAGAATATVRTVSHGS
jgi:membrane-associated phospholipid phosphatase